MTSPYTPLPPPPPPSLRLPPHRRSRIAGWLSLVIHLMVILLIVGITRNASIWKSQPLLGSQPGFGQSGGGGGREVSLMALPADAPRAAPARVPAPVVPPPVRTPTVLPKPLPPPVETAAPADTVAPLVSGAATPGTPGGSGGGSGGGNGPGTGPGSGPGRGGSGGGPGGDSTGAVGRDPEPRQLILPPFDYPKSMRGLTIAVTFFVLADGRVDHVAFAPEIPDHGYGKKLEDVMRAYRFRPARSPAGLPVPGRTTVSVSF